jgi:glycosyltransferase involved in cell wall biosynthesis
MTPLVSISTATRNYARYLPATIESVRAQTFADWEMIIVDDGSTDATPALMQTYLADRRIRYYRADKLGQTRAKNLGIAFGRGEFVAFLDADDVWEPTKLEKQLAVFREDSRRSLRERPAHGMTEDEPENKLPACSPTPNFRGAKVDTPELGVVFSRRSLIDGDGKPKLAPRTPTPPRGRVLPELFVQNFVCFSSALVRRSVLAHVGRLEPKWDLAIDFDLWLRVARHYAFDYIDEELVKYRTGHGNLSKRLLDRVNIAFSIMYRAQRDGIAAGVPRAVLAEAHASTCRTLGYVLRKAEPREAARWYLRALSWPSGRLASVKGLAATMARWAMGNHAAGAPENASANR